MNNKQFNNNTTQRVCNVSFTSSVQQYIGLHNTMYVESGVGVEWAADHLTLDKYIIVTSSVFFFVAILLLSPDIIG